MTVSISNSHIASLNLGSVVGDLNGSIQNFATAGHSDLAEAIRRLGEAIGSSIELNDMSRKDLLEHLALVSSEAARSPDARKPGPFKTLTAAMKAGVGFSTQLLTLWNGVEQALKAHGIIS